MSLCKCETVDQVGVLVSALREIEVLLINYLASDRFPLGSDCDEVKQLVQETLMPYRSTEA